jgi:hypothetical protein
LLNQGSAKVGYSKISDKIVFRHGINEVKAIYHTTIKIQKSHKKTHKSEIALEGNL